MFRLQNKKKPPPRPPPPNFTKIKSKSSFNLTQPNTNLIEWSPPSSPKIQRSSNNNNNDNNSHNTFGSGSVSSSYSSSASSLTSSKRSLEYCDPSPLNWTINNDSNSDRINTTTAQRPTIIRAQAPKKIAARSRVDAPRLSPPMPSVPPPSPPKGACEVVTPYGVALFNYSAVHSGDLSLQVDDIVLLNRRVNNEWLHGRIDDTREGIFPANFIQIIVPLPGEENLHTVLYDFQPEMPDDLALKAGQNVRVLRMITDEWLYGESNGKTGQFPSNFIDKFPN